MKKIGILLFILIFIFTTAYGLGLSQKDIATEISIKNMSIGNKDYIPARELFEKLSFSVKWLKEEKAVLMHNEQHFIKLPLNDNYFIFNGKLIKYTVKPIIHRGKFYVGTDFLNKLFSDFKYDAAKDLLVFNSSDIFQESKELPIVGDREKLSKLLNYSNESYKYRGKDETLTMEKNKTTNYALESQASDYSKTNIQIEGVDEADIVKTDGSYIYTLSNNNLYIVKSKEEDFRVISTLKFDDYSPIEFYIKDDRLITIGHFYGMNLNKIKGTIDYKIYPHFSTSLKVRIYDIKDKNDVTLIRNVEVDGRYLSSRLIDNSFYLVANRRVSSRDKELRPYYKDSIDNKKTFIDYENIRYFPEGRYNNYIITLGLNLKNLDSSRIDVNAYLGRGNNLYASEENMYISQDKYRYNIYDLRELPNSNVVSNIFKFKLQDGRIRYSSKGEVPGRILNQFSMDEHRGNFRIATTKGEALWGNGSQSTSNVYVLDDTLKILGKTKDLAPGEKIYSVRFMGDKAYVVTFRQVDPFYVIDLKKPSSPKVLGYLKIPGYSSYLHPYDENHIIGIGMDTSEEDGRVINQGVKISMFDVTDYNNPLELDNIIIGERGSYTDILRNHKSLLFSKEKNILSFPIYASSYDKSTYKHRIETQGAFVFSIDEDYKLNLRGHISHLDGKNNSSNYVRRIMFIEDRLYTISNSKIKISDFDTLKSIKDLTLIK